ncbi:MAG: saccharopine dehydrogenase C-terminal domain-containing protein [Azospirillaceae bacterium]
MKHARLDGRLVMIGFGSIGQGVLPLILRHVEIDPARITILAPEAEGAAVAEGYGVAYEPLALTRDNLETELGGRLGAGDFLLNLSVEVSSLALIALCHRAGALYLDTCIEPWPGGYTDPSTPPAERSNYALREGALALGRELGPGPTALITHGANPGLVSHFVKAALCDAAEAAGRPRPAPAGREEWAALARSVGVKAIHVAERDTQRSRVPREIGEFVNTWSVDGFVGEGCQPAELGWGTHERHWPADARRHETGSGAAIYLERPGAGTRVRTWTPLEGPFHGFLVTHSESISLADFLTLGGPGKAAEYRPTVHYAYHPCDDAVVSLHELAGKNWHMQDRTRILMDEILPGGIDELGVLLMGPGGRAYWYGSRLSVDEARELVERNNATSLQVTAAVLAGVVWALENPDRGVVEPEDMDHVRALEIATPYLGPVVGEWTDWTPLDDRARLFPEDLDADDPWQFLNILVR